MSRSLLLARSSEPMLSWRRRGQSIIQHHTPPYLLSSNMDQCLVLTSAVTALPAVSEPTDDDDDDGGGDGRSGLAVKHIRRRGLKTKQLGYRVEIKKSLRTRTAEAALFCICRAGARDARRRSSARERRAVPLRSVRSSVRGFSRCGCDLRGGGKGRHPAG